MQELSVSETQPNLGNTSVNVGFLRQYPYDTWQWPKQYVNYIEPNRTEQAFKIVQMLMDKGHVKNLTVKKFIELVNELAGEL